MRAVIIYPDLGEEKIYQPPLGMISIGTVLKKKKVEIKTIIGSFEKGVDEIVEKTKRFDPDFVFISSLSPNFPKAKEICEKLKEYKKIIGGVHATVFSEDALEHGDYVVMGEGEESVEELIEHFKGKRKIEEIKGIAYKRNGKIKYNERREALDINKIEIPDRNIIPIEEYKKIDAFSSYFFLFKNPITSMSVIRGCPYNCVYCQPTQRKMFGSKIRYRKPELVVDEMEYLAREFGIKTILFVDDLFTFSKEWVKGVCDEIKRRNIHKKVRWDCNSRVNTIDEDVVRWMKEAGCIRIRFGVESGSEEMLKKLNKMTTTGQVRKAFRICNEQGILTHAYFMFGTEGETRETIQESFKLIKEIKPDSIQLSITTPLAGTYLYDMAGGNEYDSYMKTKGARMKIGFSDEELEDYIKKFRRLSVWIAFKKMPLMIIRNPKNLGMFLRRTKDVFNPRFIRKGLNVLRNKDFSEA